MLWLKLSERTSAKGMVYLAGWCGQARVVGFKSKETDKYGNPMWELFMEAPRQERPARDAERGIATGQALRQRADQWEPRF